MQRLEQVLDSREVAVCVKKSHKNLLADIRNYVDMMEKSTELKIQPSEFFVESSYKDSTGRTLPCYFVTKKGCEFIAHKLTGQKGVEFTAWYINRFHEMEEQLQHENHMDWFVNDIRVFQHREFGILRTLKLDGQDYFIGKDVTTSLGYVNNTDTLKKRVSDAEKCYVGICDGNRCRKMVAISQKGMEELIRTGRLPLANKYGDWIRSQVIPVLADVKNLPTEKTVPQAVPENVGQVATTDRAPEMSDTIAIFRILLDFADQQGIKVKSFPFTAYKSVLHGDRIGIKNKMTLEEVTYEVAFELSHAIMHYDQGDMVHSPLAKIYNQQAEKAATMLIKLLDAKLQMKS